MVLVTGGEDNWNVAVVLARLSWLVQPKQLCQLGDGTCRTVASEDHDIVLMGCIDGF